jgi:hypothetical protein
MQLKVDLNKKMMGVAPKNPSYKLGVFTDSAPRTRD